MRLSAEGADGGLSTNAVRVRTRVRVRVVQSTGAIGSGQWVSDSGQSWKTLDRVAPLANISTEENNTIPRSRHHAIGLRHRFDFGFND